MYRAFNYSPNNPCYLERYREIGQRLYDTHESQVKYSLSKFISEDGIIDGSALKNSWFPIENPDVFISHSHKDLEKVQTFAGWLENEFKLNVFIDSCAWGYSDKLLRKLDDKFCCDSKENTYSYKLRNYTTSHVNMMLATALTEMIDRSECVIFFNTPNTILLEDELDRIKKNEKTISPWILYELTTIEKMRRNIPRRKSSISESFNLDKKGTPQITYGVEEQLEHLQPLTDDDLTLWGKCKIESVHPLDKLYSIVDKSAK